jgi:hypothetical protein
MLEYTDIESEIISIYQFLLEAAIQIPDVFTLVFDTVLPRMSLVLNNSSTPEIVEIVKAILMNIVVVDDGVLSHNPSVSSKHSTVNYSPSVSSKHSIKHSASVISKNSVNISSPKGHSRSLSGGGPGHREALSELGFVGLLEAGSFTWGKIRKCKNAKLVGEIVGAFTVESES